MKLQFGWMLSRRDVKYSSQHPIGDQAMRLAMNLDDRRILQGTLKQFRSLAC